MTVHELIAALLKFPPGQRVLVDGYEGGYDDPTVKLVDVLLDREYAYGGPHRDGGQYAMLEPGDVVTRCVVVSRMDADSWDLRDAEPSTDQTSLPPSPPPPSPARPTP